MALSPLKSPQERAQQVTAKIAPSKTYSFDMDTGELVGYVDGTAAIRQFIRKTVATARFRFPVYNGDYGCELEDLIGQDVPVALLQTEIPRVLTEALIYDERVRDVNNFVISRDADGLYVSFSVTTADGAVITEEVTV